MDKEVIEHKLHDVFEYNNIKLKICLGRICDFCYFRNEAIQKCDKPKDVETCHALWRKDKTEVYFIQV